MLFILKLFLTGLWLVLVPSLIGILSLKKSGNHNHAALPYVQGWLIMMSVFQLLVIPMIFLRIRFHVLVIIWSVGMLALAILSLVLARRTYTYKAIKLKRYLKAIPWTMVLAIILISIQTLVIVFFQHVDDDDAFYVGTAVTTIQNNSMYEIDPYTGAQYGMFPSRYVLSPFPVFIALIGKLTMLHPTIMAHTILPFFLIPLAYLVYYLIGKELFRKDSKKIGTFLCMVSVLNIWGNFSVYTTSSFLMFRIWQGKSILGNILLPLVLFCMLRLSKDERKWYYWLLMITLVLSGSMVSSMGIFLMPMSLGIYAVINAIIKKEVKTFFKILLCCIPSVIYGFIYIFGL